MEVEFSGPAATPLVRETEVAVEAEVLEDSEPLEDTETLVDTETLEDSEAPVDTETPEPEVLGSVAEEEVSLPAMMIVTEVAVLGIEV